MRSAVGAIVLLAAAAAVGAAEPSATLRLGSGQPEVARTFELLLEVRAPEGSVVQLPGQSVPVQPFELVGYSAAQGNEGRELVARGRYSLFAVTPGPHELGPFRVGLRLADGSESELVAEPLAFEVRSLLGQLDPPPADILPIKGPLPLPEPRRELPWAWAAAAAFGLTLAAAALLWRLRRRRSSGPPPEPAHVLALRQLQELGHRELEGSGGVEAFYVRLSEVLRRYLETRFHRPVMEQTTHEIKRAFPPGEHGMSWAFRLHQLLDRMDLVKFARFRISASAAFEDLQMARGLIEELVERDAREAEERRRAAKLAGAGKPAGASAQGETP
jgi:hypothetical protein